MAKTPTKPAALVSGDQKQEEGWISPSLRKWLFQSWKVDSSLAKTP
jgi:hypothetical protein